MVSIYLWSLVDDVLTMLTSVDADELEQRRYGESIHICG